MRIHPEELNVDSFPTTDLSAAMAPDGGYCCTGCVSGCGYYPTAGGCESASGDMICPATPPAA